MKKMVVFNILGGIINICLIIYIFISMAFQNNNVINEVWKKTNNSIFEITIYKNDNIYGYATGFAIDYDGHIVTNRHVVQIDNGKFFVSISGDSIEAKVDKVSKQFDIAVLQVDTTFNQYLKFNDSKIEVGEKIFTIGNPDGIGLCIQEGIISAPKKELIIDDISYLVFQTNLVINEGNSGGPILDEKGNVIGIVSFKLRASNGDLLDGITFAFGTNEILVFLNE